MSRRLSPVSHANLVRRLKRAGWAGPKPGGKHFRMAKGDQVLTIPNPHKRKDVSVGELAAILSQAGISREEWEATRRGPLQ